MGMNSRKWIRIALLSLLAWSNVPNAFAQAARPARPDCSDPVYRRFDFWVGQWNVYDTASGQLYATSRIETVMAGCGVRENYDSPQAPGGSYQGTSYTGFNRNERRWHQMYLDVNGNVTWYSGDFDGADLVLTAPGRGGSIQRMIYRPQPDGSVRQIGTVSTDQGHSWQAGYDYSYRRQ